MAKGDFYFPFLYQRFYDSTAGWTEEQEGAYIRLLTYQFRNGFIPNDMKVIKRISPKAVKNWSLFRSKFDQNSDGNFINSVMEKIRNDFNKKKEINSLNGRKGGERSSERYRERGSETGSENTTIPITNNQEPIEERALKNEEGSAHDLLNSNLFRKPAIPDFNKVHEVFLNHGGTKEMAEKFFSTHEATEWFVRGSPIRDFSKLVPGYIESWRNREKQSGDWTEGLTESQIKFRKGI